MKKIIDADISLNSIKLRQMGGVVKEVEGRVCYVKFDINGLKVAYVYHINKDQKYFLERTLPYPLPLTEIDAESTVVDVIEIDLEQFKMATQSHNFKGFVEINKKMSQILKKFEDLFLYYNVPEEENTLIYNKLIEIEKEIEKVKISVERVYLKKDPENL